MIYVENDFYSNFNNAVKSNDDKTIQGMLIDELSTLIANRRGEVIQLFEKVGIPLSAQPSNEEIVKSIVKNLKGNKKLQAGLAYLIAKEHDILASSEKSSRADAENDQSEGDPSQKEIDWNKSADTVTQIAGTIGVLADSLSGERGDQFQEDLKNKTNTKAPNYSADAYTDKKEVTPPKKKSKKWLWILLGVAVVGGVYYAYKKGKIGGKSGGGEVSTPTTPT